MAVEQLQKFTNNATTTVPGTTSNVTTSITVATGTGALFPSLSGSEFFIATLVNTVVGDPGFGQMEIIKVTARSGDVMTVTRGQEGTSGTNFPSGVLFELRPTAQAFNNIYTEVLELESTKAPLASPVFTGNPTAPTPTVGDNDTSIATTAFVTTGIANATGRLISMQVFTSSGTWTRPAGCTNAYVLCLGGGGAGGGAATTAAGQGSVGGGGGAGARSEAWVMGVGASVAVTIGAGGTGVAGGNGNAGGDTSFGTACVAKAGGGGNRDGSSSGNFVGRPGTGGGSLAGTGDFKQTGSSGATGMSLDNGNINYGGNGATGGAGGGGGTYTLVAGAGGTNGNAAPANEGSGGGGAANGPSQVTARSGGNGSSGVCVVWAYT